MPKKSNHDLSNPRLLPVPRKLADRIEDAYKEEGKAWTEAARDILDMAVPALPMKETEE